jgi:hypothetical protein
MKRVLCTVAAIMLATAAFAGNVSDLTPQQAMDKAMNCPVCSAFGADPALGPTLRCDIQPTKAGYVQVFGTADEKMVASFEKAHADCESRCMSIPTMTAEQKAKLCDCCNGMTALMSRKDVTFEGGKTTMGWVTVASASTPEGVKALHDYAAMEKEISGKLAQASMEMSKEPVKSKM